MIDSVISVIQYLLLGLIGFLVLGWVGLRIPSIQSKPNLQPSSLPLLQEKIPENLPKPFLKYLSQVYPNGVAIPQTVTAWGNGKIKSDLPVVGSVWLPISWELHLKPGEAFIWKVVITWFTRPFLRGGEYYSGSAGKYKMGSQILESGFIDKSEFIHLWIYSILFAPGALLTLRDVSLEDKNEEVIWMTLDTQQISWNKFKLAFDKTLGLLTKIETKRTTSRDGSLLDYQTLIIRKNQSQPDNLLNGEILQAWDGSPYLKMRIKGIQYNTEVEQILAGDL